MNRYLNLNLHKGSFTRNVLTLMTGTTIAQAIPLAIAPILTRIYTPDDFGAFALYSAIISIFAVVATGRYELTIMLPEKDSDAINIAALSIAIAFGLSLVVFLIVFFLNVQISRFLGNPKISPWLYFVPISIVLTGIYQSLNYWNNRKKMYSRLAASRIVQSGVVSCTQLGGGFLGIGVAGLVGGNVLGQVASTVVLVWHIWQERMELFVQVNYPALVRVMRRYKNFPRMEMLSAFLNASSAQVPVLLLNTFFSTVTTGYYFFGQRLLAMPMSLIGGSVSQVFFEKARHCRTDMVQFAKISLDTYKHLLLVGSFPLLLILFFGAPLFSFVFSEQWRIAGAYSQYLSIWMLFVFAGSPISSIIIILERQKESLIFNTLIICSRVLSIIIMGYLFKDADLAILVFGIVSAVLWVLFCFYVLKLAGNTTVDFVKTTCMALLPAVSFYTVTFIVLKGVF